MLGVRFPPPLPQQLLKNKMARVKISEFQAKEILHQELGLKWVALQVTPEVTEQTITDFFKEALLVVKVDQGIKKRGKLGLMQAKVTGKAAKKFIKEKAVLGYSRFIIEPFQTYSPKQEKYICLERTREGIKVLFNDKGGMEIEANWQDTRENINDSRIQEFVSQLKVIFDKYYFSYLEINPLVVLENNFLILDCAAEIDDLALNLPVLAKLGLEPVEFRKLSDSEKEVSILDKNTPASLKYRLINKNGSVWMMLSGGGASLVLADEVADLGYGKSLANYGEYSGNPTTSDTYLYTKVILKDLLASRAKNKVLIVAGAVANFTDVAKTFRGIIQALEEFKLDLKKQKVKVYVRRGGPNERIGLELMTKFLQQNKLYGAVYGKDKSLTTVVREAIENLK